MPTLQEVQAEVLAIGQSAAAAAHLVMGHQSPQGVAMNLHLRFAAWLLDPAKVQKLRKSDIASCFTGQGVKRPAQPTDVISFLTKKFVDNICDWTGDAGALQGVTENSVTTCITNALAGRTASTFAPEQVVKMQRELAEAVRRFCMANIRGFHAGSGTVPQGR